MSSNTTTSEELLALDFTRLICVVAPSYPELDQDSLEVLMGDAFVSLSAREQEIVIRRFGMNGTPPETLHGIAASHEGWTGERVRQLEAQALNRIDEQLKRQAA
jgi:DNA-directed RNA polymerase sigma subunit (sigma70/sigma32)